MDSSIPSFSIPTWDEKWAWENFFRMEEGGGCRGFWLVAEAEGLGWPPPYFSSNRDLGLGLWPVAPPCRRREAVVGVVGMRVGYEV